MAEGSWPSVGGSSSDESVRGGVVIISSWDDWSEEESVSRGEVLRGMEQLGMIRGWANKGECQGKNNYSTGVDRFRKGENRRVFRYENELKKI